MLQEKTKLVQIKGIRDGLLVTLANGSWLELQEALLKSIQDQAAFFKGARMALDVGNQVLHAQELGSLRDKLSDNGITLWAVISNSPLTEQTSQVLGLATRLLLPRSERAGKFNVPSAEGDEAIIVHKTLRSGTRIVHPGNVVVIGDVNPGAEIIAGGSIIIWGKLRGVVHAGAEGNVKAAVYALDMNPMQLRIAYNAAIPSKKRRKPDPEVALIQNGQVVAISWESKEIIR